MMGEVLTQEMGTKVRNNLIKHMFVICQSTNISISFKDVNYSCHYLFAAKCINLVTSQVLRTLQYEMTVHSSYTY